MLKPPKELPFENWLNALSELLNKKDLDSRCIYEEQFGSDKMVLNVTTDSGLVELFVTKEAKGALLTVVADNLDSATEFREAIGRHHRSIPRLHNSHRKFVHRVEKISESLCRYYDQRSEKFPKEPFKRFVKHLGPATPMTGAERGFRRPIPEKQKEHYKSLSREERKRRRYPTRQAIKIKTETGSRALLYHAPRDEFELPEHLKLELETSSSVSTTLDTAFEIVSVPFDLGLDIADETGFCDSFGFSDCTLPNCDLPDCDLPDLSCPGASCLDVGDCGGCDI